MLSKARPQRPCCRQGTGYTRTSATHAEVGGARSLLARSPRIRPLGREAAEAGCVAWFTIDKSLPAAECMVSHNVANEVGQRFLASFNVTTRTGSRSAARVRKVFSGPSAQRMEAIWAAERLRLSKATYLAAARRRLRLATFVMAVTQACDCGHEDAASPDHTHLCDATEWWRRTDISP